MKLFAILTLASILVACSQIDTALIEKGRRMVAIKDTAFWNARYSLVHKTVTIEEILHWYIYCGEVKTPIKNTKFLSYLNGSVAPSDAILVVDYKDTLSLATFCKNEYACDSLVNFLNQCLLSQSSLSKSELELLITAIGTLSDPGFMRYQKISSWKDISWYPNGSDYQRSVNLPDSLKTAIQPLQISTHGDTVYADYFIWDNSAPMIKRINLLYFNKKIKLSIQDLGKYGMMLLRM